MEILLMLEMTVDPRYVVKLNILVVTHVGLSGEHYQSDDKTK